MPVCIYFAHLLAPEESVQCFRVLLWHLHKYYAGDLKMKKKKIEYRIRNTEKRRIRNQKKKKKKYPA